MFISNKLTTYLLTNILCFDKIGLVTSP